MQLLTDYPWYFLLFCLAAGGVYAAALYGWRRQKDGDLPRWVRIALPALRFAVVTLLAFLLLGPLVRRQVHDRERPIVVVADDASASVTEHGYALTDDDWNPVLRRLEKDYEVVRFPYGDNHFTNIASALTDIKERYAVLLCRRQSFLCISMSVLCFGKGCFCRFYIGSELLLLNLELKLFLCDLCKPLLCCLSIRL